MVAQEEYKFELNVSRSKSGNLHPLDVIAAMRLQEDTFYHTRSFLPLADAQFLNVGADCCTKMAEWCFQIVEWCKFQRESIEIAMYFFDRYLLVETSTLNDLAVVQLAAMTALYMAVKIHDPKTLSLSAVSTLSRSTHSASDIKGMEWKILNALQWRVNPPTSLSFARQMLSLLSDESMTLLQRHTVDQITKMQLELVVADYDLIAVKPSTIAFCSIMNAIESIAREPKVVASVRYILSNAIGVDGNNEDIRKVSDFLYARVAQS